MSGFCRKSLCLFLALIFIFALSVPAFAASGRTTVYRTKTGEHYHTGDCRFLGKSKIKTTLDAAVNEFHLTPCSVCNPPAFETEAEEAAIPTSEEAAATKTTRPANGEVLFSKYKTRPSTLTFENGTNYDCLVTMTNKSGTDVLQFYVRKSKDATIDIPTISGKAKIDIPAGTQPGQQLRLKGYGIKDLRTGNVGDQYVEIQIEIPKKLTREEKELYEKLANRKKESVFERFKRNFK